MSWDISSPTLRRLDSAENAACGLRATTALCARYGVRRRAGYK